MRCGRCGNDNADANRFCGTCGAPLAAQPQSAAQSPSVAPVGIPAPPESKPAIRNSQIALQSFDPAPASRRPAPLSSPRPEPRREPVITGPSFLGLNRASPGADGEAYRNHHDDSIGHGPLQASSSSLDYLLEDEEEPKSGGWKLSLILIVLALAVGFGYLRWKRGGFEGLGDWLASKKAAVTNPAPDSAPNSSDSSPSATGTSSAPNSTAQTSSSSPPVTPIPTDGPAPNPANPATSDAPNAGSTPAAAQAATPPPIADAAQAAQPATSANTGPAADSPSRSSASNSEQDSDEEQPAAPAKPVARKALAAKPSAAKPLAAMSNNSVAEAERYIYGRGIAQDCDRGLRLLKPAAEQSNPKAMISLGALYSTGTCTPRDLPTAYRWFALALHKQPDNLVLQDDLQKLWSQMTQPERQLAIKLSQ